MLIREIVTEGYATDLLTAVQDLLTAYMANDENEDISTEQFQNELAKHGFVTTTDELIKAINDSGYASSIDKDVIRPKDQLPGDVDTEVDDPSVDVGKMAGDQAMKDIKAEL
tara:strand:+ start:2023 stop:2358 length:336 start_codon:yes stop_codon:yes gene_type:complete